MSAASFAVFDIDGTLIRWQLYHAVANELAKEGYFGKNGLAEIKAARKEWKERTSKNAFKEYERVLVKMFDEKIPSIATQQFDNVVTKVIKEYKNQIYRYTSELITELKKQGYFLIAISGSQEELVEHVAKEYKFDDFLGSTYHRRKGSFTGTKDIIALDKKAALTKIIKKHKLDLTDSIAVGDTASDIPMLEMVEKPIAFNPNSELYEHAKNRGWQIIIERKNVIYKLENVGDSYILA